MIAIGDRHKNAMSFRAVTCMKCKLPTLQVISVLSPLMNKNIDASGEVNCTAKPFPTRK